MGRKKLAITRDQCISLMCTLIERKAIEAKARATCAPLSTYLREVALSGKSGSAKQPLPREVLQLIAKLNQMAAYLYRIAIKRGNNDVLDAIERANLHQLESEIYQLVKTIKAYLL